MKFKNLFLAGAALLAFTACNSDNESNGLSPEQVQEASDVLVSIKLPGVSTRGYVDGIVEESQDLKSKVTDAAVYIINMAGEIQDSKVATKTADGFEANFDGTMVSSSDGVRVIAYNGDAGLTNNDGSLAYDIVNLQPKAGFEGIANSVYAIEENMPAPTTDSNGKKTYTLDNLELESLTGRLELNGIAKANKQFVKSFELSRVLPMKVTQINGDLSSVTNINATTQYILDLPLDGIDMSDVLSDNPTKVIANHLFAEDRVAFSLGFSIELYTCLMDNDTYVVYKDANDVIFPIYKDKKGVLAVELVDGEFTEVTATKDSNGEYVVKLGAKLPSFDKGVEAPVTKYFTMYGDRSAKSDFYEGGKIYAIDLSKDLTWNTGENGKNPGEFNPDVTPGEDKPTVKEEADVVVKATIKDWTRVESSATVG